MAAARGAKLVHASLPQYLIGMEKNRLTIVTGDIRKGFSPSGQVVGRIKDIPTCGELMERVVTEADAILRKISADYQMTNRLGVRQTAAAPEMRG